MGCHSKPKEQSSRKRGWKLLVVGVFVGSCTGGSWLELQKTGGELGEQGAPAQRNFWAASRYARWVNDAVPAGANRWNCRLSHRHPRPVVLVHGTWVDQYQSFAGLAPRLAQAGYCVFSLNLGKTQGASYAMARLYGTNDIRTSAAELSTFVEKVRASTGAQKVDLVGWSQGGIIIRSYLKHQGGASKIDPRRHKVRRVVTLGSPHRGTSLGGLATVAQWTGVVDAFKDYIGSAGPQLVTDSPFLKSLNQDGETVPGIDYTSIYSSFDAVVNPPDTARLQAVPGARVTNVDVTEDCALDFSTHEALPYAARSIALIFQALEPEVEREIPCELQLGSVYSEG